jgi:predicted phage terminase large subunit-like protein
MILSPEIREAIDSLTVEDLVEARARVRHLSFVKYCWQRPDPLIFSKSTNFQQKICGELDNALRRYREGLSTYLCLLLPSGHGKSDLASRYFPTHFLGEFPDAEAMVVSHTDDKVSEFGAFGRRIVESEEFRRLYPHIRIDQRLDRVSEWGIAGKLGKAQYISLGGGSAGKRANLICVDDFFGKREHAESFDLRDKAWQRITEDIMSRRAPVTIVIWLVTPWHVDDPISRLQRVMKDSPNFPQFKFIKFPAEAPEYPTGFLFPERYLPEWYADQRMLLGPYGYQATMMCDPRMRGGNMLRIDKVKFYDDLKELPFGDLRMMRAWDIASSVKQTSKSDPDWTIGARGAVHQTPSSIPGVEIPTFIIDDMVRGQWEAPQRQRIIRDTAVADGPVKTGVEAFAGYKDAYTLLADTLKGIRVVEKLQLPGDKAAKAEAMVPAFEAGNVWMRRAPWNDAVLSVINDFPSGTHDDDVDALACLFHMCVDAITPDIYIR